jgi:hypothetical protein
METRILGNRIIAASCDSFLLKRFSESEACPSNPCPQAFPGIPVATIEQLVNQLERDGEGIDVLTVGGVLHLTCGNPLENILVQTDAVKHVPGDLLAIYQYCKGCKIAVRVL